MHTTDSVCELYRASQQHCFPFMASKLIVFYVYFFCSHTIAVGHLA